MRYIFLITGIRTAGVDTVYRLAIVRKSSVVDDLSTKSCQTARPCEQPAGF